MSTAQITTPAAQELASSHVPLVTHLVRELASRIPAHVSRDDLTSAGLLALVQAARSFDPSRGAPFAGYATVRVRGALLDELRGIDWASRSVRRASRTLDQTRAQLATALGRIPTSAEVAQAAGMTEDEVRRNDDDVDRARVGSLQASEHRDHDELLPDGGPTPEDLVEHQEQLSYVRAAVAQLPPRLRTVVQGYFLDEQPMAEIAAELGVSESRVSQMRAEALVLMRGALDRALEDQAPVAPATGCAARRRESYYTAVATAQRASLRPAAGMGAGMAAGMGGLTRLSGLGGAHDVSA